MFLLAKKRHIYEKKQAKRMKISFQKDYISITKKVFATYIPNIAKIIVFLHH